MSGAGRRSKYRKHVEKSILEELPEPKENEQIVQVVCSRGGNLLEVRSADGLTSLCLLPTKFRNLVWIKRGDFLIASYSEQEFKTANNASGKVKYTVAHVLFKDQVKHLKSQNLWPEEFQEKESDVNVVENSNEEDETVTSSDEDNGMLFSNRNRRQLVQEESSSDESD